MTSNDTDPSAPRWPDFAHTGPGTLAGRYLRSFWQPVYVAAQVLNARPMPLRVMGELFTIFRGESGRVQVVAGRCAHRGTQLSTGTIEGDQLRCFYHGWRYDMAGQCTERPAEPACGSSVKIRSYPTREWAGLVFAYLGEGEPPTFQKLDTLDGNGHLDITAPLRPFNYFQQLENGLDEVHFSFVHRLSRFSTQGLNAELPVLTCEETPYGLARVSMRRDVARHTHFLMPNVGVSLLFGAWHVVWRVPVDDVSHISFTIDYFEGSQDEVARFKADRELDAKRVSTAVPASELAAAVLRGELRVEDLTEHPDLLSVQDGVALSGQGLIADRHHETLGASDAHIVRLRRLWAQEMRTMDQGHPVREWRWPARLEVTSGLAQAEYA